MSAPYRIQQPKLRPQPMGDTGGPARRATAAAGDEGVKSYLDRLLKMIPAEVVSLYLVGSGVIPKESSLILVLWTLIGLAGVVILRAYGTKDPQEGLPTDWTHVAISASSYMIWVYSLGGPFEAYDLHVPYLGSLLVLAWTFFIPLAYKGPDDGGLQPDI